MEESAIASQCQSSSPLQGEEKEPTLANNLEEEMKKGICASTKHEEDQVPLSSKRSQCVHLSTALNSPALPILSPRPSCRGISGTLSSPSMLSSSAIPLSPFQNKNYKARNLSPVWSHSHSPVGDTSARNPSRPPTPPSPWEDNYL